MGSKLKETVLKNHYLLCFVVQHQDFAVCDLLGDSWTHNFVCLHSGGQGALAVQLNRRDPEPTPDRLQEKGQSKTCLAHR